MIPSHIDVREPGLRATREARGLTRAELALLATTTPETLAAVEEGVQAASMKPSPAMSRPPFNG